MKRRKAASVMGLLVLLVVAAAEETLGSCGEESVGDEAHVSPFEFTKKLIEEANEAALQKVIKAGRGNPNFLQTNVRDAFSLFMFFATHSSEAAGTTDALLQSATAASVGLRARPEMKGIAGRLRSWLARHAHNRGAEFLARFVDYVQEEVGATGTDRLVYSMVDGVAGDYYSEPAAALPFLPPILNLYVRRVLLGNYRSEETCEEKGSDAAVAEDAASEGTGAVPEYEIMATEGATAAMVYIFDSLAVNGILQRGDRVAVVTPIFSPYLELPALAEYGLEAVYLEGREELGWQLPDEEIAKLRDPSVKALFMVDPMNPAAVAMARERIQAIARTVREHNPRLVVISDMVYAPFTNRFYGLVEELPRNTIGVYSFSKLVGVTGWRLGFIMTPAPPARFVCDEIIAALPETERARLHARYALVSDRPSSMRFAERLVADSRSLALAHTAGLSTPQQVLIAFFALNELIDTAGNYRAAVMALLTDRWMRLHAALGYDATEAAALDLPGATHYYALINLRTLAARRHSQRFADWLVEHVPLQRFLTHLAQEYFTVLLPGPGFRAPDWFVRVSVANLDAHECSKVGRNVLRALEDFYLLDYLPALDAEAARNNSIPSTSASPSVDPFDDDFINTSLPPADETKEKDMMP